jgi:hypothetical protein
LVKLGIVGGFTGSWCRPRGEQLGWAALVVPWVGIPARTPHHCSARRWAWVRAMNFSLQRVGIVERTNGYLD